MATSNRFLGVSVRQPNRERTPALSAFSKRRACLRVDSRCALVSIPVLKEILLMSRSPS
jgi:hypothetical protein